ncbi:MAG: TolC family protein [Selenomonadaceae bacterium]|nr:TolC family protein [Selenomonadaceae bacterium]
MRYHKKGLAAVMVVCLLGAAPVSYAADLSLQDAINLALAQNTGLLITQKGEDTAASTLARAKGSNNVKVTTSANVFSTEKNQGQDWQSSSSWSGVSASLPLYSGGANEAAIKSGELGVDAARLKTEREREDLKLSVIKAYYDALEARKTIDVDQESVNNYEAHYTNVNQLYSAGSKAKIDVLRSSVELSNARQKLIKAQNAYEVDLATLRNLLNVDRSEPLNLTTDFTYDKFAISMDDCVNYAYRNRKDLQIDLYTLQQKELGIKEEKAGNGPSLTLDGAVKPNWSIDWDDSKSSGKPAYSAGVGLSWNIFDSGVTKAKIKEAENQRDVAKLQVMKDKESIDLNLRQAYYNMREAEKRFTSTSDAVGQAEQDYYIAREKYRAGEGLMLDIIDAQLALSTARLNHISAQYDYARYKAQVENAMGIGLTEGERLSAAGLQTDVSKVVQNAPIPVTAQEQASVVPDKKTKKKAKAGAVKSASPAKVPVEQKTTAAAQNVQADAQATVAALAQDKEQ